MSREQIDRVLGEAVDSAALPGVSVAVAGPDDVYYRGCFGKANVATGAPVTRDTVFRISSLTKSVVTLGLMQLVERGLVDPDQPVSSIIPAFDDIQVLEGFDGDTPRLRRPRTDVTVSHLATHTSGLTYDVWSEKMLRYQEITGAVSSFTGKREGLFLPLTFDPGTDWAYGTGVDWTGEIIETVTGRRVDDYLRDEIFTPLRMHNTSFALDDRQRSRVAAVHHRDEQDKFVATDFDWTPADRVLSGHGLYSTVDDYTLFLQMLLNDGAGDGHRLLQPETVRKMTENRIGDIDVPVMRSAMPQLSGDAEFFPGMRKKQSLGFQVTTEQWPGMRSAGSQFWAGLFNLFYWWDSTEKLAVTFAAQLLPFQDPRVMVVFERFERAVYQTSWGRDGDLW